MIRQLAQCPYCQGCEIALSDSFDVIFNPGSPQPQACSHLVYVDGRYSQFELDPLPGRKTKMARMIGSTEFSWVHPSLASMANAQRIQAYLKELIEAEPGWTSAPTEEHALRHISRDQNITDEDGKVYPSWETEGAALFAPHALIFVGNLAASVGQDASGEGSPFDFS